MSEGTLAQVLAGETRWSLGGGPCQWILSGFPECSVDACVTDPPYELGFMGKRWDASGIAYDVSMWREVLRVLKPGAHLLAFGGTRTYHRMTCAIEDAGFEIRDCIQWLYGSGFPKSLNVSKAIDAAAGVERYGCPFCRDTGEAWDVSTGEGPICPACLGNPPTKKRPRFSKGRGHGRDSDGNTIYRGVNGGHDGSVDVSITAPATDAARQWDGWGTALKPACEPIVVARKPLAGTVAANVLEWGTGAINVDGCRVKGESTERNNTAEMGYHGGNVAAAYSTGSNTGRWPANVIHDGSPEVLEAFARYGERASGASVGDGGRIFGNGGGPTHDGYPGESGTAARFFYTAKASRAEREIGCGRLTSRRGHEAVDRAEGSAGVNNPRAGAGRTADTVRNFHPTVKPLDLMRYLTRLVTQPGGIVLDPFTGSGTTGLAAMLEGFRFVGCELSEEHIAIARARIGHPLELDTTEQREDGTEQLGLWR